MLKENLENVQNEILKACKKANRNPEEVTEEWNRRESEKHGKTFYKAVALQS